MRETDITINIGNTFCSGFSPFYCHSSIFCSQSWHNALAISAVKTGWKFFIANVNAEDLKGRLKGKIGTDGIGYSSGIIMFAMIQTFT